MMVPFLLLPALTTLPSPANILADAKTANSFFQGKQGKGTWWVV
jgi:hypothetical protein